MLLHIKIKYQFIFIIRGEIFFFHTKRIETDNSQLCKSAINAITFL